MKLYNGNEVKDYVTITGGFGTKYVSKMTEAELNKEGYYYVKYGSTPSRRYYTNEAVGTLVDNVWTVEYVATERALAEVQASMKADVKATLASKHVDPIVDTGLGYSVDGGYDKVKDFETGKKYGFPSVRSSDNEFHVVATEDYDTIITAIETAGIGWLQTKWTKEEEIDALIDVDACILYEATPYVASEEVIDETTTEGTGVFQDVTRYKNNCKDW